MKYLLPQILELAGVHGRGAFPTGEIRRGAGEIPTRLIIG